MHITRILFFLLFAVPYVSCKSDSKATQGEAPSDSEVITTKSDLSQSKNMNGDLSTKKLNDMTTEELKEHFKDDPMMLKKIKERENEVDQEVGDYQHPNGIPDPCSFVDAKYLVKKLGASEGHVKKSVGKLSPGAEKTSRSCFWKWNGGGMLVQISTNPMPEEVPNYISKSLNTKRSFGDSNLGSNASSKFVDFKGPGTYNIKHEATSRYYVSKGDDYMIFVMFNGGNKNYDKVVREITTNIFKELN